MNLAAVKQLWPLYLAVFVAFIGFSVEIPIFTSMMLQPKHGSLVNIFLGVLLGLYPLGQFFGSPVLGAFSDRIGRKPVIVSSLFVSVLCYVAISLSLVYGHLTLLSLFLFLAGLFDGNIAITQGAITDVTKVEDRSKYFGFIYVCSGSAFIIGPLLTSFFSRFGLSTTFFVVGAIFLVTAVCIALLFKETHRQEEEKERHLLGAFVNLATIFRDETLRYYYTVNFLIYLSVFGYLRVYAMYIEEMYHIGIVLLSLIVAYVSLPFIVMNLLVVPFLAKSRWKAPKNLTMVFSWLMGITMILIIVPEGFHTLWITLFLTTSALALTMTFSTVMLSIIANHEKQGAVMGNNQSLLSLAQALSAFSAGTFAALAMRLPLIIFGLIALVAGTLLFRKK